MRRANTPRPLQVRKAVLDQQQAVEELGYSGLSQSWGIITADFDRQLQGAKAAALYDEMRRSDPTIAAVLNLVTLTLRAPDWEARPLPDDQVVEAWERAAGLDPATRTDERIEAARAAAAGQAAFVQSCMEDMSLTWQDVLAEVLTCLPFGWAYLEVVYKRRNGPGGDPPSAANDGRLGWRKIVLRGQDTLERWELDEHGGIRGMWQRLPNGGLVFLPIEKGLLFRTSRERNNPEGLSMLRPAVVPYLTKRKLQEIEAIGAERNLAGMPVITLPANASDADFELAQEIVERVKVDDQGGIVLSRTGPEPHQAWDFRLLASGGPAMDLDTIIRRYTVEILTLFLAQFIRSGSDGVGSYALVRELRGSFLEALSGVMGGIRDVFNRFGLAPLLALNGEPVLVSLEHEPIAPQDVAALVDAIARLAQQGMLTADVDTENRLRALLGLPEREMTADEQIAEATGDDMPGTAAGAAGPDGEPQARSDVAQAAPQDDPYRDLLPIERFLEEQGARYLARVIEEQIALQTGIRGNA